MLDFAAFARFESVSHDVVVDLKKRHASEWRLTAFGCDVTSALPTKDFMRWTPDKNKTRYPQRNQTDAVAEAIGCCRRQLLWWASAYLAD